MGGRTGPSDGIRYKMLVVDDDGDFMRLVQSFLKTAGHSVFAAASGREALLACEEFSPDIIISDVQMEGMDGFELCRRLKADPRTAQTPIVLMSGNSTENKDQLEGFSLGVDDYVLKPFDLPLLLAKALAVLRRYAAPKELHELVQADGLSLDVQARTVSCGTRLVGLTRKEFDLLITLMRKRGHVLSPNFLLEAVWGHDPAEYNDPRTVKVHVSSLRRKLPPVVSRRIMTVPGIGYTFQA